MSALEDKVVGLSTKAYAMSDKELVSLFGKHRFPLDDGTLKLWREAPYDLSGQENYSVAMAVGMAIAFLDQEEQD